jgi:hypothetical protein
MIQGVSTMRHTCLTGILTAIWLFLAAASATAQFWPGTGYHGGYGWGGYAAGGNMYALRSAAETDRMVGQAAAIRQSNLMQQDIRNTLQSQAQAQSQAALSRQQSNRDWWFQVQQQQVAQRQTMAPRPSISRASDGGFEAPQAPKAATDIIPWQPILCEPEFAAQRAAIEAPYRRGAALTEADYQTMIEAAGQMKAILQKMTTQISAQEYLGAEAFIDQLAAEARGRIAKMSGTSEKDAK